MTIHITRPAVGASDLDQLIGFMKARGKSARITTRNVPKRVEELCDGGSVYWIIGGQLRARQRCVKFKRHEGEDGRGWCEIFVDPQVIPVLPRPRRAHQGWRYLKPEDVPPDLDTSGTGDLPPEMAAELKELGLL